MQFDAKLYGVGFNDFALDCSHARIIHFFACLMHLFFHIRALSLTSLPNWIYCFLHILEWFLMAGSLSYLCLPGYQSDALLQLALIVYQHPGHQGFLWAVVYRTLICTNLVWFNSCTHLSFVCTLLWFMSF